MSFELDKENKLNKHRTLVLNLNYEPVEIISWTVAMTKYVQERFEVLAFYPEIKITSPKQSFDLPAVVRILHNHKRKTISCNKNNVFARDKNMCCYCGKKYKGSQLNLDHVIPESQGGKKIWKNIVTSCIKCNHKKADRTPAQAGLPMFFKPFEPHWSPEMVMEVQDVEVMPPWQEWLRNRLK